MEEGEAATVVAAPPTAADRVRFVALRGPEPTTVLRFHPRVTVLSGFSEGLVEWLAGAFGHGRDHTPDGFAVSGGTRVLLSELPDAVFAAGRCKVVRAGALEADLHHLGEGSRDKLGFELNALVTAIGAAHARSEAIAERIVQLDDEIARADAQIVEMQSAQPPVADDTTPVAVDRSDDADELETLLQAVVETERLPKVLHPLAETVARALDALDEAARRYRPRAEVEEELRKWELVTAEARARLAERRATAPRVSPADLAEASRLREALRQATDRKLGMLRRRPDDDVPALEAKFKTLLARLGAHSYDDLMLIGSGLGSANVDLAIREATNVVAAAERRCADLQSVLAEPTIDELRAERAELLQRTREILGREPGPEPAAALRACRVEPQSFVDAQVALASKLREFGTHVDSTIVDTARTLITQWREQRVQQAEGRTQRDRFADDLEEAERVARQGRTMRARLAREIESRRTEIDDLEFDRVRLESRVGDDRPDPDVSTITPAIVDRVVADMLAFDDAANSGLPVIVEDPFGALDPALRHRALTGLARRAGANQIVLVTADAAIVEWARKAGDDVAIAWTAQDALARVTSQTQSV